MKLLVTGAAGLIGGELCARAVASGHQVVALVHRRGDVCGNDGEPVAGVTVVAGDVRQPDFGLAALPDVDFVVHSAAVTAFDAAEDVYRTVNVDGTAHAIGVAAKLGVPLLQVSTAYVCGTDDGVIREGATGSAFTNGYEASKAAGEALVRASGVPFAIARPSIVVGDSATGKIRDFDNIYMLFRLIASGLVPELPAAAGATLNLVPIDHVCAGLVAMVERFDSVAGQTLHLVAGDTVPVPMIAEAIAAVPGLGRVAFVAPEKAAPLPRRIAAVAGLYAPYLLRAPEFDDAAARALGLQCPPTDRAWMARLIGYCLERGFVSARPDRGAPVISA
jgi:nucleoside-diphosphate-sugar epimerase